MRLRSEQAGGLRVLIALAITEPVTWGVLYYAYPVFIGPMQAEKGWSQSAITGAYSIALLVAGAAAVPIGRWLDEHDPRWLMTLGSIGNVLLILAWSRVESLPALYAVWFGIGICSAATFYEPAFAAVTRWFGANRGQALAILTFGGGMASVIFIPLATKLVEHMDWRDALLVFAVIVAVVTIPLHVFFVRYPPELSQRTDGLKMIRRTGARQLLRQHSFQMLALASVFAMFVVVATSYHIVPLLLSRGDSASFAGFAAGAIGLFALPGRLITAPLSARYPASTILAGIFFFQAAGLLILQVHQNWAVWCFVALFGLGFGAITPIRAALVADLYGVALFAGISGVLALLVSLARAISPITTSLIQSHRGYDALLLLLTILLLAAAALVTQVRPDAELDGEGVAV